MPLFLGLIDSNSPHLPALLDQLTDPKQVWSPFGIRSLAKSSPHFGQGENYWKGPIWMQFNYLTLKNLKERYMVEQGPEKQRAVKIYNDLRKNVVDNVFNVGRLVRQREKRQS